MESMGREYLTTVHHLSVLIFLFSSKSVSLIAKHSECKDIDVSEEKCKRWFVTLMESLI